MPDADDRLLVAHQWYDNFLRDKDFTSPKHAPYLVRWVQQFLRFARTRRCADDRADHRPAFSHVVILLPQWRHSRLRMIRAPRYGRV